jgi:hypothetical protein
MNVFDAEAVPADYAGDSVHAGFDGAGNAIVL